MIEPDPTVVRVVDAQQVAAYGTPALALVAARDAARARMDPAADIRRLNLALPGGWMRVLAASLPSIGVFGYKEFHYSPGGVLRYAVHLFSVEDGRPLGIVDAAHVTTLRTAAGATAAAVAWAGEDPTPLTVGVIGSGAEARAGLRALCDALPVTAARVSSRNGGNRDAFAAQMSAETGIPVLPEADPRAAADGVDVLYLATNSGGRVVADADTVGDVPLVLSIGSTMTDQRELAGAVLARADVLVIDTPDLLHESGDAVDAATCGLQEERLRLLGDYLARPGTRAPRTVYKSIGSPEQDLVLARELVDHLDAVDAAGRRIDSLTDVKRNL